MDNSGTTLTKLEGKIKGYFEDILSRIDMYSNKFKMVSYDVSYSPNSTTDMSVNDAVNLEATISKDLNLTVTVTDGNREFTNKYTLNVPVPVNDIFVFRGKTRLNLNYLINNYVVRVSQNIVYINSQYVVYVGERLDSASEPGPNYIKNGLYERSANPTGSHFNSLYELVKGDVKLSDLDPLVALKLKLLFGFEADVLNQDTIKTIIDNYDLNLRDHICNKEFVNTVTMFFNHLKESRYEIIRKIRQFFYRSGVISAPVIQAEMDKFFNLRSLVSTGIKTPNNLNPISMEAMKNQVILSKGKDAGVPYSKMGNTYSDFIDVVITPDNANVNRLNEVTSILEITDDGTFIQCYDKNFNPTRVEYYTYLESKVLISSCVNYETRDIIEGTLTVKQGGNKFELTDGQFDFIEAEPDRRLSRSVRMIPMVNHSDSVRVSMGARMYSQSIEVAGGEKPLVATGYENLQSSLNSLATISGTVTEIANNYIEIESNEVDSDGNMKVVRINRPSNIKGIYDTNISFKPQVRLGDKVDPKDIVFSCMSMDGNSNTLSGVNLYVAMINAARPVSVEPIDGVSISTYEDALVISESAAAKFTHFSIRDIDLVVEPNFRISGIMSPSLNKLSANENLITYEQALNKVPNGIRKLRKDLLKDQIYYREFNLKVPVGIDEAYLVDVKYIHGGMPCTEDETVYQVEELIHNSQPVTSIPQGYHYGLIDDNHIPSNKNASYTIRMRLVVVNKLKRGDKITNRYGSKGVVSGINPDNRMPVDINGRRIDVMMNPAAVVSRKNITQTMELYLNKLAIEVKNRIVDGLDNHDWDTYQVREYLRKFKFDNYANLPEDELYDIIDDPDARLQVITGCYSRYTIENILDMFAELGISESIKLRDGATGRPINKPVICGDMYLIKLYHLADKKAQVTVDKSIKSAFVLGKGKESAGGLKYGNMETDALIANNLTKYIEYVDGNDPVKAGWLLAHAVTAGIGFDATDK